MIFNSLGIAFHMIKRSRNLLILTLSYIFSMREYFLTSRLFKRLQTRRGKTPTCYHCGQPLEAETRIVVTPRIKDTRHYHQECYEKMFIDA